MDALLEVTADGTAVGYASDMTGDAIIDALSGWAWQMKKNIARSKEAIPDVETLLTRFPTAASAGISIWITATTATHWWSSCGPMCRAAL